MRVNCVVEKGSDGLFAVYSEDHIGKSYFGGFGESVSEAKEDFLASIREAIEEESQAGNKVPRFEDIRVCYHYDVPSFFNYFDFINVSKFAAYAFHQCQQVCRLRGNQRKQNAGIQERNSLSR